jgi:hypothetical protein
MRRIEAAGSKLVIEEKNGFIRFMAVFFLVLAALSIAACFFGSKKADPSGMILPILTLSLVGITYSIVPSRRSFEADKTAGDLRIDIRSLFTSKKDTREVSGVTRVAIIVGTYSEWVHIVFKEGPPICVISAMKMWTFARAPRPQTIDAARQIGAFFGVPVEP